MIRTLGAPPGPGWAGLCHFSRQGAGRYNNAVSSLLTAHASGLAPASDPCGALLSRFGDDAVIAGKLIPLERQQLTLAVRATRVLSNMRMRSLSFAPVSARRTGFF